ncbi:MAG: hypothetical protein R2864_05225 [Syntrophotaleaceae bacterium]
MARSSIAAHIQKVYNQSLVAMLIAEHGESVLKPSFALGSTTLLPLLQRYKAMEAILAGQGDVAVAIPTTSGRLQEKNLTSNWPCFGPISRAAACISMSQAQALSGRNHNKQGATRFLEWLSSPKAQNLFADANLEYPVNPDVKPHDQVAAWGAFKGSDMNLAKAGVQSAAIKLMDRAASLTTAIPLTFRNLTVSFAPRNSQGLRVEALREPVRQMDGWRLLVLAVFMLVLTPLLVIADSFYRLNQNCGSIFNKPC